MQQSIKDFPQLNLTLRQISPSLEINSTNLLKNIIKVYTIPFSKEDQESSIKCIKNNNIRQAIMKRQPFKPVSNLDLKLLDVKFIAIDDNQLYLTEALHSMKKAKLTQLPSLLISKDKLSDRHPASFTEENSILSGKYINNSTLDSINQFEKSSFSHKYKTTQISQGKSFMNKKTDNQTSQTQLEQIRALIYTRNHLNNQQGKIKTKEKPSFSIENTLALESEEAEMEKYRRKIELIKKENFLIHKQISSLYRNKINQNKEPLKKIRKIEPFKEDESDKFSKAGKIFRNRQKSADSAQMGRIWQAQNGLRKSAMAREIAETSTAMSKKLSCCPLIREKINFYEMLSEQSPYEEELEKIHKKMISNNLHKNFEQYLVATSKRVPEFIKKLRI